MGGNILIAIKKKSGWLAWIIGNILWIAVNFLGEMNIPMVVMYVIYFIINISGFISWSHTPQSRIYNINEQENSYGYKQNSPKSM